MIGKIYSESIPPQELIIDQLPEDISSIEEWLSEKAGKSVSLTRPVKGEKLEIIQLVKRNANQALIQYLSKRANDSAVSGGALTEIAEQLELAELPLRIECFDISNIQGTSMVASMVVFEDGQPKKSEYRRFSIDDQSGFDDTRAINHVITRRFKRYLEEKSIDIAESNTQGVSRPKFAYPPQLVVVDGGKPQVNAAAKALRDLGIEDIALCGLAKRLEEVWLPNSSEPIIFPRHSEALYLLQRVRDEAHRFAINFHRSKRSKLMLDSFLDEIAGLGEGRRKALLDKFGTVTALKSASIEEISDVPGIGPKMAKTIFESINQKEPTRNIDMQTGEILDA
jgi:excinuclease ABC subunit C